MQRKDHPEITDALKALATIPQGRTVLRYILAMTGYHNKIMLYNQQTSELNVQGSLYNLARRSIWHDLRSKMLPETIALLEKEEPKPEPTKPKKDDQEDDDVR